MTVRGSVEPYYVTLRVNTISDGRVRVWNINGHELSFASHKAVHLAILTVVEANSVTLGIYAGYPSVSGIRKIDGAELAVIQQKTMQRRVSVQISTYNTSGVEDHSRKCSQRTWEIDESELALPEQISVPVKKIRTDETYTYDIACIADAKASGVDITRRKVDGGEGSIPQDIGVPLGFALKGVGPHDISARVDPGRVGETRAGDVKRREAIFI